MMTILCNSIYHALAERGYCCEVTVSSIPRQDTNAGELFALYVDISDRTDDGSRSIANLYFKCKDSDDVVEDGITPLFCLELVSIDLFNPVYSGERVKPEGMSKPVGPVKIGDISTALNIVNTTFGTIVRDYDQDSNAHDMWHPERGFNAHGLTLVTMSVGDYNSVTIGGRVEEFNVYVQLHHILSSSKIVACVDEDVLTGVQESFQIMSTANLSKEHFDALLSYAFDGNVPDGVDQFGELMREKIIADVTAACEETLMPFVMTAVQQKLRIDIPAPDPKEEP